MYVGKAFRLPFVILNQISICKEKKTESVKTFSVLFLSVGIAPFDAALSHAPPAGSFFIMVKAPLLGISCYGTRDFKIVIS